MNKKIISSFLSGGMVLGLVFGLASCGKKNGTTTTAAKETTTAPVTTTETPTTTGTTAEQPTTTVTQTDVLPSETSAATENTTATATATPVHEHTYSTVWSYDESYHWHAATCEHTDLFSDKEAHIFDIKITTDEYLAEAATDNSPAKYYYVCTCGKAGSITYEYGSATPHVYDQKVVSDEYLVSPATHTAPAVYEYSCKCGARGKETFTYGEAIPHSFTEEVASEEFLATAATCTTPATYYYSCSCGEKITETFSSGEALGHSFGVDGKCSREGCSETVAVPYVVTDISNEEYTEITCYGGYAYVHFPSKCIWGHIHVTSESQLFTDYEVAYDNDLSKSQRNYFGLSEDKLHLMSASAVYDNGVYIKIATGDAASIKLRFNNSVIGQETHFFPAVTNLSVSGGKVYQTCVYCSHAKTEGVTPALITASETDISIPGTYATYAYKISVSHPVCVTLEGNMNPYAVVDADGNSTNGIINSTGYLVFYGQTAATTKVVLKDILDMPEDHVVTSGNVYKVNKPGITSVPAETDGVTYCMYDVSNLNYAYSTDTVSGDYIYLDVSADEVTTVTFAFTEHTHSFDEDGNCSCGNCLSNNIESGEDVYIFAGDNTLYFNGDVNSVVTITSTKDETLVFSVYDNDDELIARGTGEVTFNITTDSTYIIKCSNTVDANVIHCEAVSNE